MERYELGSNFLKLWSRPYCKNKSRERPSTTYVDQGPCVRKWAAYLQFALPACLVLDAGKVQELVELRQAEGHQHGAKAVVVHGAGHPHALHDQEDRPAAPGSPSPRPSVEAEASVVEVEASDRGEVPCGVGDLQSPLFQGSGNPRGRGRGRGGRNTPGNFPLYRIKWLSFMPQVFLAKN